MCIEAILWLKEHGLKPKSDTHLSALLFLNSGASVHIAPELLVDSPFSP